MYLGRVMARNRHRLAALLAAFVILLSGASSPVAQGGGPVAFVSGIEDLPLMPGLQEAPEGALVFDTPAGRIVEAYASGPFPEKAVLAFYADTLPQLGWRSRDGGVYAREGEVLRIEFPAGEKTAGVLTVRFALAPDDTMQRK